MSETESSDVTLRSRIVHFLDKPLVDGTNLEYLEDGILQIKDGKVALCVDASKAEREGFSLDQCEHLPDRLIMPGFIDTHVHSSQIDVIASYGTQLLDWLANYTFPAEMAFADESYARQAAESFLDYCLAVGTTTTFAFTTSFKQSTTALFQAALDRDMRIVAGKVLMDQNALLELQDTAISGYDDSHELIRNWHGKGRLGYAVTPRFSGTCSPEQLELAGKLLTENEGVWLQTHMSENKEEIRWLQSIYPEAKDYLDTYEQFGLSTDRSIFAHCIHLSNDEIKRLADAGGSIAFCPTSNMFLGSGLMPIEKLQGAGIPISIASDVGGGTSLSMLATLAEAYKVCQMQGYSLHPYEAFYMATLGNARASNLDQYIGNFMIGKEADFVVLDPSATPIIERRIAQSKTLDEELFIQMTLGDDRSIERTYCHGIERYRKEERNVC